MARRAALLAVGGYRPFPVAEDTDLYWRMMALGRLDAMPYILGSYRLHSASVSGASVRHGRRLAIWSQLAARSEQRRQAGRDPSDAPLAVQVAQVVRRCGLDRAETTWLAQAVAARLSRLGRWPDALTLAKGLWPETLARAAANRRYRTKRPL